MTFKFRHRIAFKQARAVLAISLVLGLISTGVQIYLDLQQEKRSLIAGIERFLALHEDTATRAVYNLNRVEAEGVTSTLISHPEISQAELVDDFGDRMSRHKRALSSPYSFLTQVGGYFFKFDTHFERDLKVETSRTGVAKLIIELDSSYIAHNFAFRAATGLLFGLLYNVVLAFVFLLFFYRYLSRPVVDILAWVNQLRKGEHCEQLPYSGKDEIGELVNSFAALWDDRTKMTDQLNNTICELSKSEHFSRTLMENAGDAMFLCHLDASVIEVNKQAMDTLGLRKEQIIGKKLARFSERYTGEALEALFQTITDTDVCTFEDLQTNREKKTFPVEARGIRISLNDELYILILARDITVRKEAEQQIFELAFFDTLTGLANRRLFVDRLSSSLELHYANESSGAVLYMDLDRFKTINDSLGHGIGDKLLCAIALRLSEILPTEATCARFGGDEFVVLLPEAGTSDITCAEAAAHVSKKIIDHMGSPFHIDGHLLYCTISIGIAVFPIKDHSAQDILRHADTALYRVKALGRNSFQFYDPEMQSTAQERLQIEKGLHQAQANQEFVLWFQPQFCKQGHVIGAEVLLRWEHPEKGIILPGDFINVAEESGQIAEIGQWVLERSLRQLKLWKEQGLPESFKRLAINISPLQFMQVDFVERLLGYLQQTQLPGHMIELEITENMLLNNFEVASRKMSLLKQRGISFAIDDFGTGYSSLRYLRYLPLDILKIDRSFVTGLGPSSEEAAIIEVIIAMADRLDLQVIAEGVETEKERDTLLQLGCHCFQGYLYSKPVPAVQLYALLEKELDLI
jgi:diguanylate cyclase (GGDEF)-like protein/PAS domain S-box-containing protein